MLYSYINKPVFTEQGRPRDNDEITVQGIFHACPTNIVISPDSVTERRQFSESFELSNNEVAVLSFYLRHLIIPNVSVTHSLEDDLSPFIKSGSKIHITNSDVSIVWRRDNETLQPFEVTENVNSELRAALGEWCRRLLRHAERLETEVYTRYHDWNPGFDNTDLSSVVEFRSQQSCVD